MFIPLPPCFLFQVLTECKQSAQFALLLHRLEKKPACKGRSLETFLTYPMHQVKKNNMTLPRLFTPQFSTFKIRNSIIILSRGYPTSVTCGVKSYPGSGRQNRSLSKIFREKKIGSVKIF